MTRISRPQEQFGIDCNAIVAETGAAVCVRVQVPGTKPEAGLFDNFWFPLSQVFEIHRGDPPRIVVSAWIAKKKGFL